MTKAKFLLLTLTAGLLGTPATVFHADAQSEKVANAPIASGPGTLSATDIATIYQSGYIAAMRDNERIATSFMLEKCREEKDRIRDEAHKTEQRLTHDNTSLRLAHQSWYDYGMRVKGELEQAYLTSKVLEADLRAEKEKNTKLENDIRNLKKEIEDLKMQLAEHGGVIHIPDIKLPFGL